MDRNTFLRRMLAGAFTFGLPASPALAQPGPGPARTIGVSCSRSSTRSTWSWPRPCSRKPRGRG